MPFLPYLLVQKKISGEYKVVGNDSFDLSADSKLQDLLDAASTSTNIEIEDMSLERLVFKGYTLVNPISSFERPIATLEDELGVLDAEFFRTKAVFRGPGVPISSLEPQDGKIVVLYGDFGPRINDRKRAHSGTENMFDRMKRSKLAGTPPSTMGIPSTYEQNQRNPSEKILDDRPEPDADVAPISLLYDGFGDFLDIFRGKTDVAGLSDVNVPELHKAIDDFAQKMCQFYANEDLRRDAALPVLNTIFSARTGTAIPPLSAAAIGSIRSDGHNVAFHGAGVLVVEFKNRAAGNNAIADVELTGYVARLISMGMMKRQDLFEQWRVPCLGLTVVGPDVRFYGVVAVDHQYRLVNLTAGLSCVRSASEGDDRKALYRAFAAASVVQARILEDGKKFLDSPPPKIQPTVRRFPSVTRLRKRGSSTEYLSFQMQAYHPDRQPSRLLYIAVTTGSQPQTIIIKFAREYSDTLHEFCATRGHAPRILAFEHLPGGWKAIAMEYIASGTIITHSSALDTHRDKWKKELSQLVKDFHAEGLVHGDLRDANIITADDRVMLLDFDWAGQDGQVCYPTGNLNDELLAGRLSASNLTITKDDDNRILQRTLGKLGN